MENDQRSLDDIGLPNVLSLIPVNTVDQVLAFSCYSLVQYIKNGEKQYGIVQDVCHRYNQDTWNKMNPKDPLRKSTIQWTKDNCDIWIKSITLDHISKVIHDLKTLDFGDFHDEYDDYWHSSAQSISLHDSISIVHKSMFGPIDKFTDCIHSSLVPALKKRDIYLFYRSDEGISVHLKQYEKISIDFRTLEELVDPETDILSGKTLGTEFYIQIRDLPE